MTAYFIQAFIYLLAAVIAVPLAKRFGLGSVLGYLVAGVVIGPVMGLVGQETSTIQHFAEFGVVMMLFLIGMEIDPKALWAMRVRLLGLGGLQVTLTAAAGMAGAWWIGLQWQTALAVGLSGWAHALVVVGAVAAVIVGGYYLSRPLFRYVVKSGLREVFTATALMLIIGIAALMSVVNLSPALGAFLAGVVLANSEFRHELEAGVGASRRVRFCVAHLQRAKRCHSARNFPDSLSGCCSVYAPHTSVVYRLRPYCATALLTLAKR